MRIEPSGARAALVPLLCALAAGCSLHAAAPVPMVVAAPSPATVPTATPAPVAEVSPVTTVLAYADRVRALPPAELAAEIQRAGDGNGSPVQALQLAIALAQGNDPGQVASAQVLVQRVLAEPEAHALHPLARLLAAHLADQRRAEEQAERQARELREARRRVDSLNERLEAVRAIERSLPTQPRAPASGARVAP